MIDEPRGGRRPGGLGPFLGRIYISVIKLAVGIGVVVDIVVRLNRSPTAVHR